MQLTKFTDFSIRVLIYAGLKDNDELSQISAICESYEISKNHLIKVVHELAQLGYLETIRGKNGGIRLAMDASEISIGELVRQTEKHLNAFNCYTPACKIVKACTVKGVFHEATQAYLQVLDKYTLADVLENRRSLAKVLGIDD